MRRSKLHVSPGDHDGRPDLGKHAGQHVHRRLFKYAGGHLLPRRVRRRRMAVRVRRLPLQRFSWHSLRTRCCSSSPRLHEPERNTRFAGGLRSAATSRFRCRPPRRVSCRRARRPIRGKLRGSCGTTLTVRTSMTSSPNRTGGAGQRRSCVSRCAAVSCERHVALVSDWYVV